MNNPEKYKTLYDINWLFCRNTRGGCFSPLRAIQNLRESYSLLNIPLTEEIIKTFEKVEDYAATELKEYSLFSYKKGCKVINFPFVFVKKVGEKYVVF